MLQLLLALATAAASPTDSLLVSGEWLREHLRDPGLVVLQIGMERSEYDEGHVPGARYVSLMEFHGHQHGDRLLPPEQLAAVLGRLGISNDSRVVIVGEPMGASILYVAFDYVGHGDRTSVLDGGFPAWIAAARIASTDSARFSPTTFTPHSRDDLVVDAAWISARLSSPTVALIDGRSEAEYRATTKAEQLPRFGHIPGARHLEWSETLEGGAPRRGEDELAPVGARLKPIAVLRARFQAAGADPGDEVVAYCTVGMRASHVYFVARLLGYRARLYVGSMADWSARPELPINTGANPE